MNAPATATVLRRLFDLFAEGEMSEISVTTCRLLNEGLAAEGMLQYLNLMARADQIWDISYDYTRIRGMIWMALRALRRVPKRDARLAEGLRRYALGYLFYTGCEGGFVSNDPRTFAAQARFAREHMRAALDILTALPNNVAASMIDDIQGRLPYFEGLIVYNEALPRVLEGALSEEALAETLETLEALLEAIEAHDDELASELRAHRLFLEAHAERTAKTERLVADAEVVLGLCAYIDDDVMKQFNEDILSDEDFGESALSEWLSIPLQGALRIDALQDIFETALGEENMRASVFQPAPFILYHRHHRYTLTPTLKFSNLGVVSVEFSIALEGADEVELQSIIDLIAPHAPEVLLLDAEAEEMNITPPDIRHPFLWLERLGELIPNDPLWVEGVAIVDAYAATLVRDLDINRDLGSCLDPLDALQDRLVERIAVERRLAPLAGLMRTRRVGAAYLRTLGERWMSGFLTGCLQRYGLNRFQVSMDSARDWFSTVKFSSIHRPDGPPLSCPDLVGMQRFRWMLTACREAKASIGDWILADDTLPTNLAQIRSHKTDFLFIRGNQAWFYFPDDPYYLIDYEYTETLRLMMWIRTLVNAFTELAIVYNKRSHALRRAFLRLGAHPRLQELINDERRLSEYFKLKADDKLSLLQDCLISQYDDHARLMEAIVEHMDLDRARSLLAARLDKVIATQAFLDRQVEALSAQAREEREIRNEKLQAQQRKFTKDITTVAAGLYGTSLIPFTAEWQRYALIATIVTPMTLLLLRAWLKHRALQTDMEAHDEAFEAKLASIRSELQRGLEWSP